jgi:hypothetical protein
MVLLTDQCKKENGFSIDNNASRRSLHSTVAKDDRHGDSGRRIPDDRETVRTASQPTAANNKNAVARSVARRVWLAVSHHIAQHAQPRNELAVITAARNAGLIAIAQDLGPLVRTSAGTVATTPHLVGLTTVLGAAASVEVAKDVALE